MPKQSTLDMQPLTVRMPPPLLRAVARAARVRHQTVSQYVRDALTMLLVPRASGGLPEEPPK